MTKSITMQMAADDVGRIAEAVDALGKMLDRFHSEHGPILYEELERAWPDAMNFGGPAARPLYELERKWTPPHDQ